jgi:polysaccharide export outer membrane protein
MAGAQPLIPSRGIESRGEVPTVLPTDGLEAPVEAGRYVVVPGDVFSIAFWGPLDTVFVAAVGPQGDLVIPSVGVVRVAGRTLREASETLVDEIVAAMPRARPSVTLLRMGRFRVPVTGLVRQPGSYALTGAQRLRDALEAAGGILPGGSHRRIQIRTGEETWEVDLVRWALEGDLEQNPLLKPGMRIHVPPKGPTFRVRGPLEGGLEPLFTRSTSPLDRGGQPPQIALEWKEGDTVAQALLRAGGVTPEALPDFIYLWRHQPGTRRALHPEVICLAPDSLDDVAVYPGDLVDIPYREEWVAVTGAVHRPGRYPFIAGWRARDYVNAAGGPSSIGKRDGWKIIREDEEERSLDPDATMAPGDVIRVPETTTHKASTLMATASTAVALILSIVALVR